MTKPCAHTDYAMGRDDLTTNDFDSPRVQVALGTAQERALLKARVLRCKATFDAEFYFKHNPDLAGAVEKADAHQHFNDDGYVERRLTVTRAAGGRPGAKSVAGNRRECT